MTVRRISYHAPAGFIADTRLVNGVYVMERRAMRDRRRMRAKFRGYERRMAAERRDSAIVDVYV